VKELAKAICERFVSDPMSASFTGGIHNTVAPDSAVFPYLVFTLISNTQDITFTEKFEEYLVQFDIYSDEISPLEACNLYLLLKGDPDLNQGFDFAQFTVDGYVLLSCTRESSSLPRWEVEGKRVWNYTVTYRILLEKN